MSQSTANSPRVALVTGAARGIGRAIALRLAADGCDVAVADLSGTALQDTAKAIEALGRRALSREADISQEDQVIALIDAVADRLGSFDIMIANAGVGGPGTITDTTLEDFDRIHNVNTRGTFLCYKHAARKMIAQGRGGRIVGASSIVAKSALLEGAVAYTVSKHAVRGLTQSAAKELARHRITVNCYAPSLINTPMNDSWLAGEENQKQFVATFLPIGRIGVPDDVAHLVSYLVSEKADFITGQTISPNGGMLMD